MNMSDKHLSRNPQKINDTNWYYEGKGGIEVIHKVHSLGVYVKTDHILISWQKLRVSLRRKDKRA